MAVIGLSSAGRRALEAIVARSKDVRQYRRAQALLRLDEGERLVTVAQRLQVHRDTMYAWAARYQQRRRQRVPTRLIGGARPGRPRQLAERVERVLVTVLETAPQLDFIHLHGKGCASDQGSVSSWGILFSSPRGALCPMYPWRS